MRNSGAYTTRERGIALMVSLFLTVFLFVLGITLLYFLDQDSRFGLTMQREQQAQCMAQAGIFFARSQELNYGPDCIGTGPLIYWADPSETQGFLIWKEEGINPNKQIHARGLIYSTDRKVLASRELAAPMSPFGRQLMQLFVWDVDL